MICIAPNTITRKRGNAWIGRRKWILTSRDTKEGWKSLRGKIDDQRFNVIASRFQAVKKAEQTIKIEEPTLGAAALQDLMLQAEILVQYGMRSKAIERLQRIQELFPREEERNQDLQRLYISAGIEPQYPGSLTAPPPAATAPAPAAPAPVAQEASAADISSLSKVAEITRKLYNQGNAESVLKTAVNEMGAHWRAARAIAATRKQGLPPSSIQEYHVDGLIPGSSAALVSLVETLQDLAVARGTVTIGDASVAPELLGIRQGVGRVAD